VPTAHLTRTVEFKATHHYFRPEWSGERNAAAFGPASAPHAHSYQCAVTVAGPVDPTTGMVLSLTTLDRILAEEVVARFDGRDINRDVAEYGPGGAVPSCEELCLDIWRRVSPRLPASCRLAVVRVQEQPALYAEYRGGA
jgi:6-pyruvoyltetrahydropterin/6-carboxytetrahydropterin synthase